MRIIMEQAFGGKNSDNDPNVTKLEPKSNEEAKSMLAGMFKKQ